jgi:hypothetical protein
MSWIPEFQALLVWAYLRGMRSATMVFLTISLGRKDMIAFKNVTYVTDERGNKKSVVLDMNDFERIQNEIEDLEDALELEKARKNATGFKKWKDFIREVEVKKG